LCERFQGANGRVHARQNVNYTSEWTPRVEALKKKVEIRCSGGNVVSKDFSTGPMETQRTSIRRGKSRKLQPARNLV
jgi:hypothetical protein